MTFGSLLEIVNGDEFDDELVASGGEEGPWVTTIPATFVDALADLGDDRLAAVAEAWSQAEELGGIAAADARETIVALRELCRRARAGDGSMLMWMSL